SASMQLLPLGPPCQSSSARTGSSCAHTDRVSADTQASTVSHGTVRIDATITRRPPRCQFPYRDSSLDDEGAAAGDAVVFSRARALAGEPAAHGHFGALLRHFAGPAVGGRL